MPIPKGSKRVYFPKVTEAREALREKALEILESYLAVVSKASEAGEHEAAIKGYQWILEHLPADGDNRVVDTSVDKTKEESSKGQLGPQINIGIALGGMTTQTKQLPEAKPEIIDITPNDE